MWTIWRVYLWKIPKTLKIQEVESLTDRSHTAHTGGVWVETLCTGWKLLHRTCTSSWVSHWRHMVATIRRLVWFTDEHQLESEMFYCLQSWSQRLQSCEEDVFPINYYVSSKMWRPLFSFQVFYTSLCFYSRLLLDMLEEVDGSADQHNVCLHEAIFTENEEVFSGEFLFKFVSLHVGPTYLLPGHSPTRCSALDVSLMSLQGCVEWMRRRWTQVIVAWNNTFVPFALVQICKIDFF